MADFEPVLQDEMAMDGSSFALGVGARAECCTTTSGELDGYQISSYQIDYEKVLDDTQHSPLSPFYPTWSDLASTPNLVFDLNDDSIHNSLLSIGTDASLLIPESLIQAHYRMQMANAQDDLSFIYIDPQLLYFTSPATNETPIEARHLSTVDTRPDHGIFSPPTTATAAYLDGNHITAALAGQQVPPLTSEAPAQSLNCGRRSASSGGRSKRVRLQDSSPRHKKRRAQALEILIQPPLYHSLPSADQEYFDQIITNLRGALYLVSPQTLEPTVGSPAGLQLVGPRRSTGPGIATDRESVYAILVDRPLEGAYVCWICGEKRTDRRLPRALDHVRGHFEHRPHHCLETHVDQRMGLESPPPLASVCNKSFSCAEALKDHQVKMRNKSHGCNTCGKAYANSANVKRHIRKEHSN